jgi:hypothetical protein
LVLLFVNWANEGTQVVTILKKHSHGNFKWAEQDNDHVLLVIITSNKNGQESNKNLKV